MTQRTPLRALAARALLAEEAVVAGGCSARKPVISFSAAMSISVTTSIGLDLVAATAEVGRAAVAQQRAGPAGGLQGELEQFGGQPSVTPSGSGVAASVVGHGAAPQA